MYRINVVVYFICDVLLLDSMLEDNESLFSDTCSHAKQIFRAVRDIRSSICARLLEWLIEHSLLPPLTPALSRRIDWWVTDISAIQNSYCIVSVSDK